MHSQILICCTGYWQHSGTNKFYKIQRILDFKDTQRDIWKKASILTVNFKSSLSNQKDLWPMCLIARHFGKLSAFKGYIFCMTSLFNRFLLRHFYGIFLGTGDNSSEYIRQKFIKHLCPHGACILVGTWQKKESKIYIK